MTSTPAFSSASRGPTPESCRRCGLPIAPAQRTTASLGARFLFELVSVERVGDADRAIVLDEDPGDEGPGHNGEVRPPARRPQVSVQDTEAPPAALGDRNESDPLRVLAVQIRRERDARCLGRVDEGVGENVAVRQLGEGERAFGAAREDGLDVVPRPPGAAGGCPRVVVGTLPAQDHHRVHRCRPAEHPPAREHDLAAVETLAEASSSRPSRRRCGRGARRPPGSWSRASGNAGRPRAARPRGRGPR